MKGLMLLARRKPQNSSSIWYIENLNDEFVALLILINCRPEDRRLGMTSGDGKKHNLYVCCYSFIEKLIQLSKQTSSLRYNLYIQRSKNTPLRCVVKTPSETSPGPAAIVAELDKYPPFR